VFTATYPGEPVDPEGVRVHRFRPLLRLGNAPLVPQIARISGFDLIHLHQPFIFGAEAALIAHRRTAAPIVSTYHNELRAVGVKGALFQAYDRVVSPRALRASAIVAALSEEHAHAAPLLRRELQARPDAVRVVPNGVDVETFRPGRDAQLRAELGFEDDAIVACFCARLDNAHLTKRLDLALEAVAAEPELRLVVVGGGPLLQGFEGDARDLGISRRVRFTGNVTHEGVARYFRVADLLMMPSTLEAFGIVQVEAMASGLPVLISRIEGARAISTHGVHGIHVDHDDAVALARGARELIALGPVGRAAMGRAGRELVLSRYTWAHSADHLELAYCAALAP
jgi:glycosyltransferase involved in cell wall biosynthesis